MEILISLLAAIIVAGLVQYFVYKKLGFKGLRYEIRLSESEVFEGDEIYLYEEITNDKHLPLPFVKVDSDLPEGLSYCLFDENKKSTKVFLTSHLQSVFVLRPGVTVKRRWRVRCVTRGEYKLTGAIAVTSDLIGFYIGTKRLEFEEKRTNCITVLPRPVSLEEHFTSSRFFCGDVVSNYCPITDPLRICGNREYVVGDPINTINWKSTAAHDRLMVNIREKTVRHSFNILLNMNSREIEQYPTEPSDPAAVEKSINVVASILDRISVEDIPVRIITNNPCEGDILFTPADPRDEIGKKIMISERFRGKRDMPSAFRTLSSLKMKISVPAEKMLDHIAAYPELYRDGENLVVVSPYIDSRLLNLHEAMKRVGVNVVYYVTSTRREAVLPEDVDVYFKAY